MVQQHRKSITSLAAMAVPALFAHHALAAEKHVHGHGVLLVAQEAQHWQLQFTLPAADLLGFEHAPTTDDEIKHVKAVKDKVAQVANVFAFSPACQVLEQDIDFPGGHHEEHDEADHDEESHEDHDEHEAGHHHHEDIKLTYSVQCDSDVNALQVNLFDLTPSLHEIEVQWIVGSGQGMTELTGKSNTLQW